MDSPEFTCKSHLWLAKCAKVYMCMYVHVYFKLCPTVYLRTYEKKKTSFCSSLKTAMLVCQWEKWLIPVELLCTLN